MTYLSLLVHFVSQRRANFLIPLLVVVLAFAQPLLVSAKPIERRVSQLAELAQSTPSPQEEPTEEATEESTEESTDEEDEELEPTEVAEEPTTEAPADQPNFDTPEAGSTDVITVEIPADETIAESEATDENGFTLPFTWEGDATVSAADLATVAPPLQAEVIQGDFQVSFVSAETGNVLRILPDPTAGELGALRLGAKLDPTSSVLPFPAGQTLTLQFSARLYAPEATTRFVIADDSGSSSVPLEGLNWNEYQVTRQIATDATSVEIMLDWHNVPANGWLELRDLNIALAPAGEAAALSPTDTPTLIEAVTITPTAPIPPTPTPTQVVLATATPLSTATPVPEVVAAQATPVPETAAISETVILTPTPTFIVVTSTPTPVDVYEEATRVAQATDWARILGPATPTPPNLATETPTITPFVVTNTPEPANAATATQVWIRATAIAFTTGTPTPLPANATVVAATATSVPPTATSRPSATPTPLFVLLEKIPVAQPTVTPMVPAVLEGKILFLSSYRGNPNQPNAMVMNPDGTGVGLLTTNYFYNVVKARDAFSADGRFRVYSLREWGGAAHNAGRIQLFYDDSFYSSTQHQLTYFGAGVAWSPAWSPTSETIALVSSESQNDEIWVVQRNQWPPIQLTKNQWEWDHHPSFSPDGSEIVFSSNRVTGRRQLWIMTSSGGDQRQLTNFTFEAWNPVWVKYVEPITEPSADGCDPNYAGVCVPADREAIDCLELLPGKNFGVIGVDRFSLDSDNDGIACEE